METIPVVTLIVKAPNQQIEDQTIKCELSWTINKLKQHLSEVYPSRPPKHEQKLIYSGQLLNDSVVLKDVLRQYDDQGIHTVHLVCTPKHTTKIPKRSETMVQNSQPTTSTTSPITTSTTNTTTSSTTQLPATINSTNREQIIPNMQWNNIETNGMDPNQYAMQLAWMQQAYLQYMAQYMQLAANTYGIPNAITNQVNVPSVTAQPQQNQPEQQPAAPPPAAAAAPAPAAQPAAGAPVAAQRDLDNPERDWLDIFYLISRLMVLFSVVYFYSSPLRFLFVLILAVLLYLYQLGFFRNINNNNNNNNNALPDQVQQQPQAPSRLMIVWTFFATFFASLIPEIPNAL